MPREIKLKMSEVDIPLDRHNPLYWVGAFDFGDIKQWIPDDYKGRVGILIKLKLKIKRLYEKIKAKR